MLNEVMQTLLDSEGELPSYAWPGGYQMYYVDGYNSVICPGCANKEVNSLYDDDGEVVEVMDEKTLPVQSDINYEDESLYCEQCNELIPAAYGENDE